LFCCFIKRILKFDAFPAAVATINDSETVEKRFPQTTGAGRSTTVQNRELTPVGGGVALRANDWVKCL
jgi:hypothetical protein